MAHYRQDLENFSFPSTAGAAAYGEPGDNGESYIMENGRENGHTTYYPGISIGGVTFRDDHAEPRQPKQTTTAPQLKNLVNVGLRLLTLASCIAGFVMMITDSQTTAVPYPFDGVVFDVQASAKWHYSTAFVWFVIATGIVAVYALVSTLVATCCLASKKSGSSSRFLLWLIFILDLVMMNILMSALASSLAVALLGKYGNTHTQWPKICNNYGRFCDHAIGALVAGSAGFLFLFQLCVLDAYHLHIQHKRH